MPEKHGISALIFNAIRRVLWGRPTVHKPRTKRPGQPVGTMGDETESLYSFYGERMRLGKNRAEIYDEVDTMDSDDLPAATLDTYAEDATPTDPATGRVVWLEDCSDHIRKVLEDTLERTKMEEYTYLIVRSLAKYGDFPVELYWQPGDGIQQLRMHHPKKFRRFEEVETGALLGFYIGQDAQGSQQPNMQPWELVHFRIFGSMSAIYGTSMLINARRSYRRLRLAEDASIIYRLQRHADRDVFHLNVTNMTDTESAEYMKRFVVGIRKNKFFDPQTGELREDWNPFTANEDLILPQIEGRKTEVQRLAGSKDSHEVADLDYHLARFHSAVRVPPAFFGYALSGAAPYEPQKNLSHQDSRYSKVPLKLQHYFLLGLHRILQLDLAFRGLDATAKENTFTLAMSPVSYLDELHRQQLIEIRIDIIDRLLNLGQQVRFDMTVWIRYVLKEYGKLSDEIIEELLIPGPPPEPGKPGEPPKPPAPEGPPPPPPPEMPAPPGPPSEVPGIPEAPGPLPGPAMPGESIAPVIRKELVELARRAKMLADTTEPTRIASSDAKRFFSREPAPKGLKEQQKGQKPSAVDKSRTEDFED